MKIGILGLWHQGIVGAACFARLGYHVTAADRNEERIRVLQKGHAGIYEPGLDELLQDGLQTGRLRFTADVCDAVRGHREVLLMFDTPVNEQDESDLREIFEVLEEVIPHLEPDTLLLVTAQVPVGTCAKMRERIRERRPELRVGLAYWPENLRLGVSIDRFMHPPLPVIGADEPWILERAIRLLSVLTPHWQTMDLKSAEMVKHALNAFLAVSVCFGNEIGNLCDEVGADGLAVAEALRTEPRIGPHAMLSPGLGFSGGTLARDMQTLRKIGREHSLPTLLLDAVWEANKLQNGVVLRKLRKAFGKLEGLTVGVLGLTYKPGTSTLRRSAALEIIRDMAKAGMHVRAHDPKADRAEVAKFSTFTFCEHLEDAVAGADAIVLITPWPEYRQVDFIALRPRLRGNVIIDTANLLDHKALLAAGYRYMGIGRGLG